MEWIMGAKTNTRVDTAIKASLPKVDKLLSKDEGKDGLPVTWEVFAEFLLVIPVLSDCPYRHRPCPHYHEEPRYVVWAYD